jgi:hypothetical protein
MAADEWAEGVPSGREKNLRDGRSRRKDALWGEMRAFVWRKPGCPEWNGAGITGAQRGENKRWRKGWKRGCRRGGKGSGEMRETRDAWRGRKRGTE